MPPTTRALLLAGAAAIGWCAEDASGAHSAAVPVPSKATSSALATMLFRPAHRLPKRTNEIFCAGCQLNLIERQRRDLAEFLKPQKAWLPNRP